MTTSHLDDGEFARLLYAKVSDLIGSVFNRIDRKRPWRQAMRRRSAREPLNLFWFAHHNRADGRAVAAAGCALPDLRQPPPTLSGSFAQFILRGIGLNEAAIASHLDCELSPNPGQSVLQKVHDMNIQTESHLKGQPIGDVARKRPVAAGALVHHRRVAAGGAGRGGLVWFNSFRGKMIAQFFANNQTAADQRQHCRGEVRDHSEPVDRGRRSCRRASGQCSPRM